MILLLLFIALLVTSIPGEACEPHRNYPLNRQYQVEGRSWGVGDYTKRTYKGRDAQGNRIGGTIESLPSGAFKFKGWEKRSPVEGRVQRFLDSRRRK